MNQCKICSRKFEYSKELRKKGYTQTKCNSCSVNECRTRQKTKAIEYKGGKCQMCGYDRCPQALCFHHIDPSTKSFTIGKKGSSIAWGKLQEELDKCVLLCQNCHHETHAGMHKF